MDRTEATWRLLRSYVRGLLIGNVLFISLVGLVFAASVGGGQLRPATLLGALAILPLNLLLSVIGGVLLGFPILLVAWITLMILFDHVHRHLKPWCVVAPAVVAALWLVGEQVNLAGMPPAFAGPAPAEWQMSLAGPGARVALALLCASLACMHYYRSARMLRA